jgi:type 1 fimbria pilin
MLKLSFKKFRSLLSKTLTGFVLSLFCFSTSLQASTDTTNIGIAVVVKSSCQISVGESLNEQSVPSNRLVAANSYQLRKP